MSSLKRKRIPTTTFRNDIEVHTQKKDGTWSFVRQSLNDVPFAAVYNAINKTMRMSAYGLTSVRMYHIIDTLKPSEMSEETFLNMLLSNLKQKYQKLVQRGWALLGDTRYTSTALVNRIIRTIEKTNEDLEMIHELYDFLDQSNETVARKPFKMIRKKEMNIPLLKL